MLAVRERVAAGEIAMALFRAGYSQKEIAAEMGTTVPAVKSLIARARRDS